MQNHQPSMCSLPLFVHFDSGVSNHFFALQPLLTLQTLHFLAEQNTCPKLRQSATGNRQERQETWAETSLLLRIQVGSSFFLYSHPSHPPSTTVLRFEAETRALEAPSNVQVKDTIRSLVPQLCCVIKETPEENCHWD